MPDLNNDLRLAVETGSVAFGVKETMRAITADKAKSVVISAKGKGTTLLDIIHLCNIAGIKVIKFKGNSMELGAVCGRPHSISSVAIIDPGTSKILEENYEQ